jgi:ABC-type nitrate/sulfonate/bicarbonate transport system permease component
VISDGELGPHLATSGYEVGLGVVFGVLPALAFGLLASLHPYTRRVFEPLMLYFSAVPYIIIFPVFILAFTIGPNSKVAMAAASAFFPMAINTITASFDVREVHLKVGRALRLSGWQMIRYVYLPSMAPGMLLGLRMAVGVAIVGALLAETKAARAGLGFLVFGAYRQLNISRMYALLLLIFILAAAINWLMSLLAARSVTTRARSNASGFFV